jgi:hypothetical protein
MIVQAARGLRDFEMNQRHLWGQYYESFTDLLTRERVGITADTYAKYVRLIRGDYAHIPADVWDVCGVIGANQVLDLNPEELAELTDRCRHFVRTYHHPAFYQWMTRQIIEIRGVPPELEWDYLIRTLHTLHRRAVTAETVNMQQLYRRVLPHIRNAIREIQTILEARGLNSEMPNRRGNTDE